MGLHQGSVEKSGKAGWMKSHCGEAASMWHSTDLRDKTHWPKQTNRARLHIKPVGHLKWNVLSSVSHPLWQDSLWKCKSDDHRVPRHCAGTVMFSFPAVCLHLILMKMLREIYQPLQLLKRIIQFVKITFIKKADSSVKKKPTACHLLGYVNLLSPSPRPESPGLLPPRLTTVFWGSKMLTWLRAQLTSLAPAVYHTLLSVADSHRKGPPHPMAIFFLVPHPGPLPTLDCFSFHSVRDPPGNGLLGPSADIRTLWSCSRNCALTSYSHSQLRALWCTPALPAFHSLHFCCALLTVVLGPEMEQAAIKQGGT